MWTKIINYKIFADYGIQLGAKVSNSKDHKLNFLMLGERKKRYIFRLDKMLLSYFSNKNLINKIAFFGGDFLFLTSRKEYYETIRLNADICSQAALLWRPAALSSIITRIEALDELYESSPSDAFNYKRFSKPNVFVLFDNEKSRSKRLIGETDIFLGVPLFTVMDSDSIVRRSMFPIFGNDDSSMSIYFYSFFCSALYYFR